MRIGGGNKRHAGRGQCVEKIADCFVGAIEMFDHIVANNKIEARGWELLDLDIAANLGVGVLISLQLDAVDIDNRDVGAAKQIGW